MTCHGDLGQGLTDDFRGVWPEDHQNCWAHGCHNGTQDGGGFPIPRFVPPLVGLDKLSKFSQQGLFEYLKSTHPPQTPGVLEDEQYLAIVKYLFFLNERQYQEATPVPTITPIPIPTFTPIPDQVAENEPPKPPEGFVTIVLTGLGLLIGLVWLLWFKKRRK